MAAVTERQILDALGRIVDPEKGADIVSLGMVSGVVIRDGNIAFAIEVEPERGPRLEPLRKAAEQAVEALPNVLSVTAVLTAQAVARGRNAPHPAAGGRTQRGAVAGVSAIVAVASGKGESANRRSPPTLRWRLRRTASPSACSMPTSMARRCRACWGSPAAGRNHATARCWSRWRITGCASCRWGFSSPRTRR